MAELLCLPKHVLELIVARTATSLSRYEESWGAAATTCKCLHDLQLPGEYAVIHDLRGLPWLMPRLQHAKAIEIDAYRSTYGSLTRSRPLRETVRLLLNASSNLSNLNVLVLRLDSNDERIVRPLVPWIFELLLGASSLHTLEFNVREVPCPPILRRLPLKHLTLTVRSVGELLDVLEDLSYCRDLENLCITSVRESLDAPFIELPAMDLSTAAKLRHVKLTDFAPGHPQLFLLPAGCALSLVGSSKTMELWSKRWVAGRDAVMALSVWHTGTANQELSDPVLRAWPKGINSFPALKYLQLDCVQMAKPLDLAVFAHIPCLKIRSKRELAVTIHKGSWQLLELEGRGKFNMSIVDLHSFLCSVTVFAFTLPASCLQSPSIWQLLAACSSMDVPVYEHHHRVAVGEGSVDVSRRAIQRLLTKLSNDKYHVRSINLNSDGLMGVWPADPVRLATLRLKRVA